jgi:hypothetical protein
MSSTVATDGPDGEWHETIQMTSFGPIGEGLEEFDPGIYLVN